MSSEMWMDEARQLTAQCWCDDETKDRVMDPVLAESVARRIAWLIDKRVNLWPLRDKAFIHDDGGIADSPWRPKIPEWVYKLGSQVADFKH